MQEFSLQEHEYILLCNLLKAVSFCDSGGQAKMVISEGNVKVNGEVELKKRCKIRKGSIIEFSGQKVKVTD